MTTPISSMQVDASVGKVLEALDQNGVAGETLVIVTSDNGCSPQADFPELRRKGHDPSGGFRGHKADIFEGGHRIPFLVRWPGKVKPGSHQRAAGLPDRPDGDRGGDRRREAARQRGRGQREHAPRPARPDLRVRSARRSCTTRSTARSPSARGVGSLRSAPIPAAGVPPGPAATRRGLAPVQLYDLAADPSESRNLQAREPEVVKRLTRLLERYVADGRSTPGVPQPIEGKVDVHKAANSAP